MAQYDELVSVLRHLLTEKFSPKPSFTRGLLGDGNGNVQVPGRPDKSFVRFNRGASEFFEIFNKTVTPVNDWPVLIGEIPWQPGLTQVVDTDWSAFEQSGWGDNLGNTSPHAPTHEWPDGAPGSDPVNIYLRSIVPGRAYVAGTGTTTIFVNSLEYENQASGTVWAGTPGLDLSPIMGGTATGTMRYAGIYIDPATNTLAIVTGTTTVHSSALTPPLVSFPKGVVPSARVRIYGGQASLSEADIVDARRPFNPMVTGSAGGGGAPVDAQFVTLSTDTTLTAERVLTAGQNIHFIDGGAGSTITVDGVLTVKNTTGVEVFANEVGYINATGTFAYSFAAAQAIVPWCVTITGATNGNDLYVVRQGRVTVNYTGTAPSAGDYLVTSTTAGYAQRQTTMHPAIFAVCTANGAGGTVEAQLLCNTVFVPYTSTHDLYRCDNHSSSTFTGAINGSPTTTSVVYTVSTGSDDILPPAASGELAKLMLYNSTRSTYRLITAVNTGTTTITTVSSTDSWADTDTITIKNAAINYTAGPPEVAGYDLSQQSEIPVLARAVALNTILLDSGGSQAQRYFHPYKTYSNDSNFISDGFTQASNFLVVHNVTMPLIDQKFGIKSVATGTGTAITVLRVTGYFLAVP